MSRSSLLGPGRIWRRRNSASGSVTRGRCIRIWRRISTVYLVVYKHEWRKRLHHICIVVHDLDKTVAYYEGLGIGPWYNYPKGSLYVELEVEDAETSSAMRATSAPIFFDNVQFQLCQPPQLDCPRGADSSKQMAKVCSTLGFEVPELAQGGAGMRAAGVGITARGRRADGSGFCYFDTRDGAGVTLREEEDRRQ